jgi:hypothetical protein
MNSLMEGELAEINRLAQELGYIDGADRTVYENLLGAYFDGADSARNLSDHDRSQWLAMLRLWRQGSAIAATAQTAIDEQLAQRRTA